MSAPPTWTYDRPAVEGYYWLRMVGEDAEVVEVVEVFADDSDDGALHVDSIPRFLGPIGCEDLDGCEWSGPLAEPGEGA